MSSSLNSNQIEIRNKRLQIDFCLIPLVIFCGLLFSPQAFADAFTRCIDGTQYHHTYSEHVYLIDDKTHSDCLIAASQHPNSVEIQFGLARTYGYQENYEKKRSLLEALARNGHVDSLNVLANMYYFGEGVKISPETYFNLTEKAYDLGSVNSMYDLYYAYNEGFGVNINEDKAMSLLEEAADMGHSRAIIEWSELQLVDSTSSEAKKEKATSLLLDEIAVGNNEARLILNASRLFNPESLIDIQRSLNELIALGSQGDEDASYYVIRAENDADYSESVLAAFDYTIERKYSFDFAMNMLDTGYGVSLLRGVIQNTFFGEHFTEVQAEEFIQKLSEISRDPQRVDLRTSIDASLILSELYSYGVISPVDEDKAMRFLKRAADEYSDPYSGVQLSYYFHYGEERYSLEKAMYYANMGLASKQPLIMVDAYNSLGMLFEEDKINGDLSKALENYTAAANLIIKHNFEKSSSFNNLARLYLHLLPQNQLDIDKFYYWAQKADKYGDDNFFKQFYEQYELSDNTSKEQVFNYLESEVIKENPYAALELVYYAEAHLPKVEQVKWNYVCQAICDEGGRAYVNMNLTKFNLTMRGLQIANAANEAQEWLRGARKEPLKLTLEKTSTDETIYTKQGKTYALLIGIQKYDFLTNLSAPLHDIDAIGKVLEDKFGADITYLRNPQRRDITRTLNDYRDSLNREDSLIIYYAGHGYLDEFTGEGYWLPRNAEKDDDTNWISNNYVLNKLKTLKAMNILLIADSCFSGSIIKRGIQVPAENLDRDAISKYLNTTSRIAFSSGGLSPVLDGGGGINSIYANSLINALRQTNGPITSAELYVKLRDRVTNRALSMNIDQTPLRGEMLDAGHEGPDFVFLPRN